MNSFNGDVFMFRHNCRLKDGTKYIFNPEERIKVIIYDLKKTNNVEKDITIERESEDIDIILNSNDMKTLKPGRHILEIKLLSGGNTFTTYQGYVFIKESWCQNV